MIIIITNYNLTITISIILENNALVMTKTLAIANIV